MKNGFQACNEVWRSLRRIIRAIDLNSRRMFKKYGLTGPQLLVLRELSSTGSCPVGELAKKISLSHATVTEIVARLEKKGYVARRKSDMDKRKIFIELKDSAKDMLLRQPAFVQEQFTQEFSKLPDWEQSLILSNFQKVASLMQAEKLDGSPFVIEPTVVEESKPLI